MAFDSEDIFIIDRLECPNCDV